MGGWVSLIWRATGSLKNLHTWADRCRGKQCRDERRVGFFPTSNQIPMLKVDVSRWEKHRLALRNLSESSNLSRPRKKNYIGNYWWAPLRSLSVSGAAVQLSRSDPIGTGRKIRASWTIPSSRLPGGLHGMRCLFSGWTSERALQTRTIVLAAAVVWKKWMITPSTTVSEFVRSGITSVSGRLASNPNSSCCSTLVTS